MVKIGRNAPCPCGSGMKFKKCHLGREDELLPTNTNGPVLNKQFNRYEMPKSHFYINTFGSKPPGKWRHRGFIKCKLLHGPSWSIIVPDILLINDGAHWIQPLAFHPNVLVRTDDDIYCSIPVDISGRQQVVVEFQASDWLSRLEDGSELFSCDIVGAKHLTPHASGVSHFKSGYRPFLELYHHTSESAKEGILRDGSFRPSRWNIQGTKELTNVGYTYLTHLNEIRFDEDLRCIAMASDEKIYFNVDGFNRPKILLPGFEKQYEGSILVMKVYRSNTLDRRHTIKLSVEASALAPAHLWIHTPQQGGCFYAVANPYIHRIGMIPGSTLRFTNEEVTTDNAAIKRFEYVVVGDATTIEGLKAPFDEEDTTYIFKHEHVPNGSNILRFWFDNGSKDLYSGKSPELQRFA